MCILNIQKAQSIPRFDLIFLERQLEDDVVMDFPQGFEVVAAIFGILTPILTALGILLIQEANEKEKDIWTANSVLDKILWEYRYREIYPTIMEFVEFYNEAKNVRKDRRMEEIILEPQHRERACELIERIYYYLILEQRDNAILTVLKILEYFDDLRKKGRKMTLREITHDSSNIEEIENKLRKLRKDLEGEENIRKTHQDLRNSCNQAGWLFLFSAFLSLLGIILIGIAPAYLSLSSIPFWIAEIGSLSAVIALAVGKRRRYNGLKRVFLSYKMEYARSGPYYQQLGGE
jgi:ABC-type multidrug transport system fused ATPase/permease subunit